MSIPLKNKLLQGAEQSIERSLTPVNRANYMKIVVQGLQVGLKDGDKGIFSTLRDSADPVSDCALGAVNLVMLLRVQSQGTMPDQAMAPAAATLMLHALDFAEQAGLVAVDMEALTRAMRLYTNQIFKARGITPQMLTKAAGAVRGVVDNPEQMELIKRRAGVVRDPRASSPVDVVPRNRAERRRQRRAR